MPGAVVGATAGRAAADGEPFSTVGAAAADNGSGPSRVSAHQIVPTTASAPVAANSPTNVRAERPVLRASGSSPKRRDGGVKCGSSSGVGVGSGSAGATRARLFSLGSSAKKDTGGAVSNASRVPGYGRDLRREDRRSDVGRRGMRVERVGAVAQQRAEFREPRRVERMRLEARAGGIRARAGLRAGVAAIVGAKDARERWNRQVARLEVERRQGRVETQFVCRGVRARLVVEWVVRRGEAVVRGRRVGRAVGWFVGLPLGTDRRAVVGLGGAEHAFGGQRLDFSARLVEHGPHALPRFEHDIAGDVERVARHAFDAGAMAWIGEQSGPRGLDSRRVGGLDGGVELGREDQQFPARLDDDAADVTACGGDDVDRLALGGLPHLVAHPHESVGLFEPGAALLTVLIEQAGHPGEVGLRSLRRVLIGHD